VWLFLAVCFVVLRFLVIDSFLVVDSRCCFGSFVAKRCDGRIEPREGTQLIAIAIIAINCNYCNYCSIIIIAIIIALASITAIIIAPWIAESHCFLVHMVHQS
jgi:hypothetical protein